MKFTPAPGLGNGIYVSISKYGSDTPVTRPETDKAGLSSRDRKNTGSNAERVFKGPMDRYKATTPSFLTNL